MFHASGWKSLGCGSCLTALLDPGLRKSCSDWHPPNHRRTDIADLGARFQREERGMLEREAESFSKAHKAFLHDKVGVARQAPSASLVLRSALRS